LRRAKGRPTDREALAYFLYHCSKEPMDSRVSKEYQTLLLEELRQLDAEAIDVDGKQMKPSQCYHWEADPAHLLYNTNCPQDLRQKLQAIISKYVDINESSPS
jgi:hypothetical protein